MYYLLVCIIIIYVCVCSTVQLISRVHVAFRSVEKYDKRGQHGMSTYAIVAVPLPGTYLTTSIL